MYANKGTRADIQIEIIKCLQNLICPKLKASIWNSDYSQNN